MNENLIPINIISGFLGSGKTTLLTEVLKNKSLKNTAVIIHYLNSSIKQQVGIAKQLIELS